MVSDCGQSVLSMGLSGCSPCFVGAREHRADRPGCQGLELELMQDSVLGAQMGQGVWISMWRHRCMVPRYRMRPLPEARRQGAELRQVEWQRMRRGALQPSGDPAGHSDEPCGVTLRWQRRRKCYCSSRASVDTSGARWQCGSVSLFRRRCRKKLPIVCLNSAATVDHSDSEAEILRKIPLPTAR